MSSGAQFKRGEVVWCEMENWSGLAVVHSHNHERDSMAVGLVWITHGNTEHYFRHSDGCDAYVPAEWLTRVEGVEHD